MKKKNYRRQNNKWLFVIGYLLLVTNYCFSYNLDSLVYFFAAKRYEKIGNYKKAIELYEKVKKISPNLTDAYYSIADIYTIQDKLEEAITELKKIKEIKNKEYISSLLENLNIDKVIEELEKKVKQIKEEKKKELQINNKEIKLSQVIVNKDNSVKVYRGKIDNLKEEMKILAIKNNEVIAQIIIEKVSNFYSTGKIIYLKEGIKLEEGKILANSIAYSK